MKYLNIEVFSTGPTRKEWDRRYDQWMEEFATIREKFPKRFLKEFDKYHFHDNIINSLTIEKMKPPKSGCKYHLNIKLLDYEDRRYIHDMDFYDVLNFRSDLNFEGIVGVCDWLYSEILPVGKNRFSWEVRLFGDDHFIYFDFAKMRYKKIRVSEEPSAKR